MNAKSTILLTFLLFTITSLDNGAAELPPLALSTASAGCNIDEFMIKDQIEQLLSLGLAKLGYKYLLIEDCWQGARDSSSGRIREDVNKFPSGFRDLVAYAHSKGILIGLGTDISTTTALGRPGSQGYEKLDAQTYAQWQIDWVSIGNSQNLQSSRARFVLMSQFILEESRKIVICIDNKGKESVQSWASSIANVWSTSVSSVTTFQSLENVLVDQKGYEVYSGSGAWNYPSPISSILTVNEFLPQLATWIGLKSPIVLMAPLQGLDKNKLRYLQNQQLLSISQDSLKKQAKMLRHAQYSSGWQSIWGAPLSKSRYALFFINGFSMASEMSISLQRDAGLSGVDSYWIRDPISGANLGSSSSDELRVDKVEGRSAAVRILHL